MNVKQLNWEKGVVDCASPFPGFRYVVAGDHRENRYRWWIDTLPGTGGTEYSNEAARSACQKDFETRLAEWVTVRKPPTYEGECIYDAAAIKESAKKVISEFFDGEFKTFKDDTVKMLGHTENRTKTLYVYIKSVNLNSKVEVSFGKKPDVFIVAILEEYLLSARDDVEYDKNFVLSHFLAQIKKHFG